MVLVVFLQNFRPSGRSEGAADPDPWPTPFSAQRGGRPRADPSGFFSACGGPKNTLKIFRLRRAKTLPPKIRLHHSITTFLI